MQNAPGHRVRAQDEVQERVEAAGFVRLVREQPAHIVVADRLHLHAPLRGGTRIGRADHEAVRLHGLADVDEPGRSGVPGELAAGVRIEAGSGDIAHELVELVSEGVVHAVVAHAVAGDVDQRHDAAGTDDARHLVHDVNGARVVLEEEARPGVVERAVGEAGGSGSGQLGGLERRVVQALALACRAGLRESSRVRVEPEHARA
jgi:hypothetical protein